MRKAGVSDTGRALCCFIRSSSSTDSYYFVIKVLCTNVGIERSHTPDHADATLRTIAHMMKFRKRCYALIPACTIAAYNVNFYS